MAGLRNGHHSNQNSGILCNEDWAILLCSISRRSCLEWFRKQSRTAFTETFDFCFTPCTGDIRNACWGFWKCWRVAYRQIDAEYPLSALAVLTPGRSVKNGENAPYLWSIVRFKIFWVFYRALKLLEVLVIPHTLHELHGRSTMPHTYLSKVIPWLAWDPKEIHWGKHVLFLKKTGFLYLLAVYI